MHGLNDASTDEAIIRAWAADWPDANVGIRTGQVSGVMAIDVDVRGDGYGTLRELEGAYTPLPNTPTARTGSGGIHMYFAHPGDKVKSLSKALGPGIDVKADGGMVVAPPSKNAVGPYEWLPGRGLGSIPLAAIPKWVLDRLSKPSSKAKAALPSGPVNTAAVLAGLPEGQRDQELWRLACKFRRADLPQDIAEELIEDAAGNCTPPYPVDLAIEKVRRAYQQFGAGGRGTIPKGGTVKNITITAQEAMKWLR